MVQTMCKQISLGHLASFSLPLSNGANWVLGLPLCPDGKGGNNNDVEKEH